MFFSKQKFSNNKGSILLLAMLVMSGSIVTGLAVGSIILSEVRQSRNIDDAITAYYASESGLEQAIYLYRKDNATFTSQIEQVNPGDPAPAPAQDCYFNMSNFGNKTCVAYSQDAPSTVFTILPGSVQQINFFNEALATGYGVDSVEVVWTDANPDNGIEPWLEMEVVELLPDFSTGDPVIFVQPCGTGPSCTTIDGTNYSVASNYFETSKNYKVRFRALYDTVNVQVTAYDGVNGAGSVVGNRAVNIYTTGGFRTAQQSLRAQLTSGVTSTKAFADFVIYSECDLVKGFGLSASCP